MTAPADKEPAKSSNFLRQVIERDLEQGTYAQRKWAGHPAAAAGAPLTVLAGGTDLLVKWSSGQPRPARVLSLHRLAELRSIALEEGAVRIGACCTHAELQ